jgi:hypothetical protein
MRKTVPLLIWALVFSVACPSPARAWNDRGHMLVAAIAYRSLSTAQSHNVRAAVDALLKSHPDYAMLSQGISQTDPNRGLIVFMRAATWPDKIRSDPRFYDDTDQNATEVSPSGGFPDMAIHKPWHFMDLPYSDDGTPTEDASVTNAWTQIIAMRKALTTGDPASHRAYSLAWLLHLMGDIHQPLHATSRYSAIHKKGDNGGNGFKLSDPNKNLHTFWDHSLGENTTPQTIITQAASVMKRYPQIVNEESAYPVDSRGSEAILGWITESATLGRYVVYTLGAEPKKAPFTTVPAEYRTLAGTIAQHRAASGGYRLARMLNTSF